MTAIASPTKDTNNKSRHVNIRMPLDCWEYLEKVTSERENWSFSNEIVACVRAKMLRKGWYDEDVDDE